MRRFMFCTFDLPDTTILAWKVDDTKWSRSERLAQSFMLRVRRKVPEGSLRPWTRIVPVARWICEIKTTRSLHLKWLFGVCRSVLACVCYFLRIYNILCTLTDAI